MRLVMILLMFLGVGACQRTPPAPLRVGLVVFPAYEPAFLARDAGAFGGAPIELIDYASPSDSLRAFRNGSIDVAGFTVDFALDALATNPDSRVFFAIDVSVGADAVVAAPAIGSLADLRGKRVGMESSTLGAVMLTRALEKGKLDWADVTVIPIDIPDHEAAFADGKVDAVVTYDPARERLVRSGNRIVFSSAEIEGEIVDVLIASGAALRDKGTSLQALVDGWLRFAEVLRERPETVAGKAAAREGLTAEQYQAALQGVRVLGRAENHDWLAGERPRMVGAASRVMEVMVRRKMLIGSPDLGNLVEPRFVVASP